MWVWVRGRVYEAAGEGLKGEAGRKGKACVEGGEGG